MIQYVTEATCCYLVCKSYTQNSSCIRNIGAERAHWKCCDLHSIDCSRAWGQLPTPLVLKSQQELEATNVLKEYGRLWTLLLGFCGTGFHCFRSKGRSGVASVHGGVTFVEQRACMRLFCGQRSFCCETFDVRTWYLRINWPKKPLAVQIARWAEVKRFSSDHSFTSTPCASATENFWAFGILLTRIFGTASQFGTKKLDCCVSPRLKLFVSSRQIERLYFACFLWRLTRNCVLCYFRPSSH